jgi:hypothetical protein
VPGCRLAHVLPVTRTERVVPRMRVDCTDSS